jgi:hypothetical protein
MADGLDALTAALGKQLVLVDVGSSGGVPPIWRPLGRHATYVGFDPDAREVREVRDGEFARAVYINKAVAPADAGGAVRFFLTRSPYCSSTLRPNPAITGSFLSAEKFIVEGETRAPATTLGDAVRGLGLAHVDWLKIDTQGTDLAVFHSLPDELRRGVLAADLEPGLRGAYVNEQLFSDVHAAMLREGMWLSRMEVLGFPRMRKGTLDALSSKRPLDEEMIKHSVRRTPGWVECRYLRTLESLAERGGEATRRDYIALWLFAHADQQHGYCLDIASEFERRFGRDALAETMMGIPLAHIDAAWARHELAAENGLLARLKRKVRSFVRGAAPAPQPHGVAPSRGNRPELLKPAPFARA